MIRVTLLACAVALRCAAPLASGPVRWSDILHQPDAWYGSAEARDVADHVLQYQRDSGGWPKDLDMTLPPAPGSVAEAKTRPDSTIDNGATLIQIRLLSRIVAMTGDARYRAAALRGIEYLLTAQYPNGGWPQFYPLRNDYSRHITFNDNAMIGVMHLLDEIRDGLSPFGFVDASRRQKADAAITKAVDVILRSQIRVDGQLTAWCAQHDEVTLEPRKARTYEHASLSGSETVGIVRFLMGLEKPDARIIDAIESGASWLRRGRLQGNPPQWARFYEIGTNRPIFSGRDGIVRYRLEEIELERREGYAWLGTWPRTLLEKDFPAWKTRMNK